MAITLYWASGSPYSWRVQLALELKRLRYDSRLLEFSTGDLQTPAYRALNPRCRVPTLTDDGVVVYESVAILTYLDRRYPKPALFGTTPAQTALVMQRVCEYESYLDDAVERFILPIYGGKTEHHADQIKDAVRVITSELDHLERIVTASDWLAGDTPSAADLVAFPGLKSIDRAARKPAARAFAVPFHPLTARYPALVRWVSRIESLPNYDRTYPPHWR